MAHLPITESTPLRNPYWQYSRDKIASEDLLVAAYRERGFPATIIRPSHTYDGTSVPLLGGWTAIDRMRRGKEVVVQGDGTSLWTLTHTRDFAVAFTGLLGNDRAVGEAFHITSDEVLTWNQVGELLARAAGAEFRPVHVASATIARELPEDGPGLLGDKAHSVIFDNAKVKALVPEYRAVIPFWRGAHEIVEWHDADAIAARGGRRAGCRVRPPGGAPRRLTRRRAAARHPEPATRGSPRPCARGPRRHRRASPRSPRPPSGCGPRRGSAARR